MRIINKRYSANFSMIREGECFLDEHNRFHIKTEEITDNSALHFVFNAVDLGTGSMHYFEPEEVVQPVEATVTF